MQRNLKTLLVLILLYNSGIHSLLAQNTGNEKLTTDSSVIPTNKQVKLANSGLNKQQKDSIWLANHIPQKATRRSALIPGWGQAYNREYWKIPLAYGVIAIPTVAYLYNNSYYKKTKFAFEARFKAQRGDSSDIAAIDPELTSLSISSLQNYRNTFRRNRDYSILWFVLAWGLQVVDATVFGHLKHFNVSNDLSLQIHPQINAFTKSPVLTMSFSLKDPARKPKNIGR